MSESKRNLESEIFQLRQEREELRDLVLDLVRRISDSHDIMLGRERADVPRWPGPSQAPHWYWSRVV